jgi:hypothetical protein
MKLVLGSRNGRVTKGLLGVVSIGLGMALSSACSGNAAPGTSAGALQMVPASGSTNSTPTWRTTVSCPNGFQGSATFKEVHANGTSTNFIAPIVNGTASPFSGTLQASIAQIQGAGGIPDGGTQKLYVTCFSQPSGLGNPGNQMVIYITYSTDGSTYSTSSTH